MKKINILLCSLGIACTLTGCGRTVELTEEENEIITEYAVGLLLKYDKYYSNHLVELSDYEEEADSEEIAPEEEDMLPEEEPETEEPDVAETPVVDMAEEPQASTIEEFYGIDGIAFQYVGYELLNEYPEVTEDSMGLAFVMEATGGMKLLVLKFQAVNLNGIESELNMLDYGTKIRVAVNGESPKGALSTMLLNDIQTYRGVIGAAEPTELVAVIEVPDGTYVENLAIVLRNDTDRATLSLQ